MGTPYGDAREARRVPRRATSSGSEGAGRSGAVRRCPQTATLRAAGEPLGNCRYAACFQAFLKPDGAERVPVRRAVVAAGVAGCGRAPFLPARPHAVSRRRAPGHGRGGPAREDPGARRLSRILEGLSIGFIHRPVDSVWIKGARRPCRAPSARSTWPSTCVNALPPRGSGTGGSSTLSTTCYPQLSTASFAGAGWLRLPSNRTAFLWGYHRCPPIVRIVRASEPAPPRPAGSTAASYACGGGGWQGQSNKGCGCWSSCHPPPACKPARHGAHQLQAAAHRWARRPGR